MARCEGFTGFSALMLALIAAPAALVAQGTTTSALMGVVRDAKGKPVSGATVRIASPAMIGGERVMRTMENGSYRFPVLPPGRYRIVVEAPGQTTITGIEMLELGRTSTVNWKFAASAGTVVEVVGSTVGAVDTASVNLTQNFGTEELASLPTDRSLTGIMNLTPGVNGSQAWGGHSRENAYMMDGMNVSDPSGNSIWIFPNIDWFSEVQMGGLGAPAEYGGFMGGFLNGLIKRGGNTLEGSLNTYYGDSRWQAKTRNSDPRITAEDRILAPSKDWDVALSVGGPIIKDKLWYFASVERIEDQNTPIGASMPQRNSKLMALAKLTWQPAQATTLEFLGEHDYLSRDRRGLDRYTEPIASLKEPAPNQSFSFTWTQVLGADKVFTLKAFGFSGTYDLNAYNGEAPPLDVGEPWTNGIQYYNNAQTVDKNYRARTSVTATFDVFKSGLLSSGDSHAFRFGLEREWAKDEELRRYPGGVNLNAGWDDGGVYTDFIITGGGWDINQNVKRLALFAQDTWTVNDRLTLRPGVRFEQFQAGFYGGGNLWNKKTFAPRFGLTYAISADQKTLLKAHWGRYFAGYSTFFIDRAIQSAIPMRVYNNWGNYDYIDPYNPSTWPTYDITNPVNYEYRRINDLTTVDPNAKQPHTDETTVSLEHKFKGSWSVATSWVYRKFKDILVRKDIAPDPDGVWTNYTNPINNQTVPVYETGLLGDEHQYVATTAGDDAKRRYWAATLSVDRKLENDWSLNASYTRARSSGNMQRADGYSGSTDVFTSPNNRINSDGLLPGFNDHEFKARMLYQFSWNMRVSGTFTYLSGERWTPYFRSPRLGGIYYYVNTAPLGSEKYPSRNLLDLRLSQFLTLNKTGKLEAFVEVFNAFNSGATLNWDGRVNASTDPADGVYSYYRMPDSVETGRRLRLGLRYSF
jgi:hypothetical protein